MFKKVIIEEIKADLLALEEQADGLLQDILNFYLMEQQSNLSTYLSK